MKIKELTEVKREKLGKSVPAGIAAKYQAALAKSKETGKPVPAAIAAAYHSAKEKCWVKPISEAADYSTKSKAIKTVVAANEKTGGKPRHAWAFNNGVFTHYIGNKVHKKVKIGESLREAAPEWIKHPSAKGVMIKNPRWEPSFKQPRPPASGMNRSEAMKARHAAYRKKLDQLFFMVERAVGETFPDGEPIDHLPVGRIKAMFNLGEWDHIGDLVNKAVRLNTEHKDLNQWLSTMWDDYAADSISDAKNGHAENNSPFYRVGDNGEIEPEANPWKPYHG